MRSAKPESEELIFIMQTLNMIGSLLL